MIERCAEAVSNQRQTAIYGRIRINWKSDDMSSDYKENCRDIVIEVIKAMREPTEKMINIGNLATAADLNALYVFKNMINAIVGYK